MKTKAIQKKFNPKFAKLNSTAQSLWHVYLILKDHKTNTFFYNLSTIAELTGHSIKAIKIANKCLEESQIISIERSHRKTNIYTVIEKIIIGQKDNPKAENPYLLEVQNYPQEDKFRGKNYPQEDDFEGKNYPPSIKQEEYQLTTTNNDLSTSTIENTNQEQNNVVVLEKFNNPDWLSKDLIKYGIETRDIEFLETNIERLLKMNGKVKNKGAYLRDSITKGYLISSKEIEEAEEAEKRRLRRERESQEYLENQRKIRAEYEKEEQEGKEIENKISSLPEDKRALLRDMAKSKISIHFSDFEPSESHIGRYEIGIIKQFLRQGKDITEFGIN